MSAIDSLRLDKTYISTSSLFEESDEKKYWLSKTPQERLQAVEFMRQVNYRYDPSSDRLQRVLTIVEFSQG